MRKTQNIVGGLLCVALLFTVFTGNLPLPAWLRATVLCSAAFVMGVLGVMLFPRKGCKRPIVKSGLLLGASFALIGGGLVLVASLFDCHVLLASLFVNHASGGLMMCAATIALSEDDMRELKDSISGLKAYGKMLKELPETLKEMADETAKQRSDLSRLKKSGLARAGTGVYWIGEKAFVSDECAQALTATFVLECARIPNALEGLIKDSGSRERVLSVARNFAGLQTRTALDSTTTPLPTVYVPQIVELVWKYGQARQYATVYPLGAGLVKLPRLKAGEDDFGFLGAGTAGMSQNVPEKRATAELVTFTANKCGGIVRIPTEIEEDTFIPIGQFLARYIARQLAKLEDKTMFLGDGSSTYANQTGVGPYCVANNTYLLQLGSGKTKPSDATLGDFRALRSKINAAALVDDPAYYMNPTMEALLVTFNTIGSPLIYRPATGTQPATLDGFPIRWVGIMQPYSTAAAASSFIAMFGALSFWYLGERGTPRVEVSREVFFATDELAMRALERFDVEAMAIDAMSALETAAS